MSQFYRENCTILTERWPDIAAIVDSADDSLFEAELVEGIEATLAINGIQLTSRHDRKREAKIQDESIPQDCEELHLYGVALGDLIESFLSRKQLKKLHIHILNEALLKIILNVSLQTSWLNDKRVSLHLASDFKEIQFPFFALPAELLLASSPNSKLRDRVAAEVEVQYLNQRFKADNPEFVARLKQNEMFIKNDADVSDLFRSCMGRDAFIFASGPTLETHLDKLKSIFNENDRPLFIALDTSIRALNAHGIQPDYVVSVDKEIGSGHFTPTYEPITKLIYFPLVNHGLLTYWKGPRYCAYSRSAVYDLIRNSMPHSVLYTSGSVIHPATDLAVKLGVKSITFFGADFGFPFDKTHSGWENDVLCAPRNSSNHWVLNGKNESIKTLLNFRGYLCSLERYIAKHPEVTFYNSSQDGALIEGTKFHPEFVNGIE